MARPDSGPIYIFDTAAWIDCRERAGDNRIPVLLDKLHERGRICSPKQVFGELEDAGSITPWIEQRRRALLATVGMQPAYARNVGLVQHKFPGMGRAMGPKERADPFVVALSLTYNQPHRPWIVITAESRNGRPRRKIPGACDILKLPCMTLDELLEKELGHDEDREA
jgi:hypothetical protein